MDSTWGHGAELLIHVAMGLSLAACAGLRAFLPLLVVGLAGRLELLTLSDSCSWLTGTPALVVFGAAVVAELAGDKLPVVDSFLDVIQTFVKPIAGALLAASVVSDWAPLYIGVCSIVAGGSAAGLVHLTKAKLRLASTLATGGIANPVLSVAEDVGALAGSIAAIVVPLVVAVLLVLCVGVALVFLMKRKSDSQPDEGLP